MGVTLSGNEEIVCPGKHHCSQQLTKLGGAPFLRKLHAGKQGGRPVSSLPIRHAGEEQLRNRGKMSIPFGVILRAGLLSDDRSGELRISESDLELYSLREIEGKKNRPKWGANQPHND